jgi:hypothetical protein
MSISEIFAIFGVGIAAGLINAVVGSGTLITFPTLIAFGYSPFLANISNNVGLVPGNASGVIAYRRELRGQSQRLCILGTFALLGGIVGSVLLLQLPGSVFTRIVPILILFACALVVAQPRLSKWLVSHRGAHPHGGFPLVVGVFLSGVYGGYFGAAQGVILIALLGIFLDDQLQRLNAAKNVFAGIANAGAALLFIAFAHIAWEPAGLIAAGSIIGGQIGGRYGRLIPARVLRPLIVVVGVVVSVHLLLSE